MARLSDLDRTVEFDFDMLKRMQGRGNQKGNIPYEKKKQTS